MTDEEQKWIATNNSVCALLRQVHDAIALSSLPPKRKWVGLTDEDWKDIWSDFDELDTENDFQDHMTDKYGEGHYTDNDLYWQFQQQEIKRIVNAKLKEKNA